LNGARLTKTVHIRTYGCQMNVYDGSRMADLLRPFGFRPVEAAEEADLVILNTCHIREKAAEKLYSDLGRLKPVKAARAAAGRDTVVAVAGCVAQAEGAEIARRAPIVDIVVGPQAYHRLPELLAKHERARERRIDTDFAVDEKFDRLGPKHAPGGPAAFLTVQEGCDKFCTFCVVPYTRGPEASRPVAAIEAEARALVESGAREITLLGQNVNAWRGAPADPRIAPGADGAWGLGQLCRHLSAIDGLERLRFATSHPRDMDDGLIAAFGDVERLMPFLHLPVQSGSDRVLEAMNRGHTAADYLALAGRLRAARADLALSSDFIVGFPGETEEDFSATCDIAEAVGFASAYAFKYSRRPGTPAAAARGQVAEATKDARLARLNAILDRQKRAFNAGFIGKALPVLFDKRGRRPDQLIGRSPYLQSVHARAPDSLLGRIVEVRIEGATMNALAGAPPQASRSAA
jgi:tRNA-2-methylthio-N6-dimethylallyladenosine synthase